MAAEDEKAIARGWESSPAALVACSPLAFIDLDEAGLVRLWNPAAERLFGWSEAEMLGRLPPFSGGEEARGLREQEATGVVEGEGRFLRRDGTTLEASLALAPILDGQGRRVGTVAAIADITARKRIEEERDRALAREQELRVAAEDARRRVAFLAEASTVLASSLEYEATLAAVARLAVPALADWCIVDLIEGGAARRVAVVHRDPARAAITERMLAFSPSLDAPYGIARALRTGRSGLYRSVRLDMLDLGPEGWARHFGVQNQEQLDLIRALGLASYLTVAMRARGRILGALSFISDQPKRFAAEDLATAEDLAQRAALAVDNSRFFREAQEAIQVRDDFISIASHEFRTPITSLKLAVQSLSRVSRKGPAALHPDFLARTVDTAERQTRRLSQLVDTLLDVSRLRVRRLELDRGRVELVGLVRDVLVTLHEEVGHAGCAIEVKARGEAVGYWDRSRLEQVVTNLLSNAIKYGAGKPVEALVEVETAVARLTVVDQGIGIDPAKQERIFEPFERAVPSRHYGGLGLGLHIVRSIVEAHEGRVRVHSAPGQGSRFVVELPRNLDKL